MDTESIDTKIVKDTESVDSEIVTNTESVDSGREEWDRATLHLSRPFK